MHSTQQLIKQYQLLTDWYISVLEDIKDEEGKITIHENANSLEWLAGHLIVGRYRNMLRLGLQLDPYKHLDKFVNPTIPPPNAIAFSKNSVYPTLTECRQQWNEYSQIFMKRLKEADEKILRTEIPFNVATGGNTVEDALHFIVMHESYHIGQMSIIRKHIGHSGMKLGLRK